MRPFFAEQVLHATTPRIAAPETEEKIRAHLFVISNLMEGRQSIHAAALVRPLTRYSIGPGKVFAPSAKSPDRFKILRLVADDVVIENERTRKVETVPINRLMRDWESRGMQEVSFIDQIVETVRKVLGPVLGAFLTASLIAWLMNHLSE